MHVNSERMIFSPNVRTFISRWFESIENRTNIHNVIEIVGIAAEREKFKQM